jgi:hypothetical protein
MLSEIHLAHPSFAELAENVISVGDNAPDEVIAGVCRAKCGSIGLAEACVGGVFDSALRTDFECAHARSNKLTVFGVGLRASRVEDATQALGGNTSMKREYRPRAAAWSMN